MLVVADEKPLTNEQVMELIRIMDTGTPEEKDQAGEKLYRSYYKFIINFLARNYSNLYGSQYREELISACALCMWENLHNYDPSKGKFTTFLLPHLIHTVGDFFCSEKNQTSYYGQQTSKIFKCIKELEKEGKAWNEVTIVEKTGIAYSTVKKCLEQMNNTPVHYESSEFLEENITEYQDSPELQIIAKEEADSIRAAFKTLTKDEKRVIFLAFGFGNTNKPMSNTKIAATMGLKIDQVKRLKNNGMDKISRNFEREGVFQNRMLKREITVVNEEISFVPRGSKALEEFATAMEDIEINF